MASIDGLYIELQADAVKANDSIDRLSEKIGNLSTSISNLKTGNLTGLANGVDKLASSMQGMKAVGTADFTRLTKNLDKIGEVNTASLNRMASATTQISKALSGLAGAEKGIKAVGDLANGIKQLGYTSSTKAIDNIPRLATAMKNLMSELSQSPKVSKNLIKMTNALADFSRSVGGVRAATTKTKGLFNGLPTSTSKASKGFTKLASTIGKVYATYWLLFRAFGKISQAMTLASNLTEVENVINHTFGALRTKLDAFTKDSIEKFGLGELAAKQYAGRFQAMGKAMGISNNAVAQSTEFLNGKLGKNAKIYGNLGNSMADMSVNITKLTSDYASFFDMAQSDVAEDFQSIFTGTTKPLRQYGIDLTAVNLKQFALNNGLNSNIATMTQAEKAMLRYQYVMANSSHIMGDFARTADTWHNVIVRLKNNFQALGTTVGRIFINLLKPVAVFVNNAVIGLNKVAKAIENALGKLLGWKYEEGSGGMTSDYEDAAEYADDMASGTGKAAKAAKELKKQLQGIDELNVLTTNNDNDNGGGSGSGTSGIIGGANTGTDGSWVKTKGMYDSDVNTWKDLGSKVGGWLKNAMDSIPWDEVYTKAGNFGNGLAQFLNGLFEGEKGETFGGKVGRVIANSLNTALTFLNEFAKEFSWEQFGLNLADGLSERFRNFKWGLLAETLNRWVDGLKTAIVTYVRETDWGEAIVGAMELANGLELDTIAVILGGFAWFHGGKEIVKDGLKSLLSKKIATGIGKGTIALNNPITVSLLIGVAVTGYEFGNWLYENTAVGDFSDAIAAWIFKDGEEIAVAKTLSVALTGLAIAIPVAKLGTVIVGAFQSGTVVSAFMRVREIVGTALQTAISGAFAKIGTFFATFGTTILKALGVVGASIAAAIAGWNIGQWIYEKISGEEIGMSFKEQISEIASAFSDGTIKDAVKMMWGDIKKAFSDGWTKVKETANGIASWFDTKVASPIKSVFDKATSKISSFFSTAWSNIKTTWTTVTGWFTTNITTPVSTTFNNLKTNIKSALSTAWTEIKTIWSTVSNWFTTYIKTPITNTFNSLKTTVSNALTGAWTIAKNVWSTVSGWFNTNIKSPLATTFSNIKTNIGNMFSGAWDTTKTVWGTATSWFSSLLKNVSDLFSGKKSLKQAISDAFKDAYSNMTKTWDAVGTYFKGIAKHIIEPIGKAINGVIGGINWVLSKVGSSKKLSEWSVPQFAKGTNGLSRDTLGVVNDQKGSTYREMIIPPHGKPFIPEGRNVMLPLTKGTKIMPANQTKRFVNNMPHFEGGIGNVFSGIAETVRSFTGDVSDYLTAPAKIMKIAVGKFVDMSGMTSPLKDIASGAVNKVFDSSVDYITKLFDGLGSSKVEKAVRWAIGIANNPAHGYDQGSRWGNPDYDCSSLVISAFEQAGIKLKSSGATYTGNMYAAAIKNGFKNVTSSVSMGSGAGIKRGDILLNTQHHTALAIGKGGIVQASANEFGRATGGRAGDQTGREILTKGYYNYPWNYILRFSKFKKGIGTILPHDFVGAFASGGFPEDGWLRASHGEFFGSFDNGQSVVANNNQITEGISSAVQRGNKEMVMYMQQEVNELRKQNDYLSQILEKETGISYKDVFKATQKGNNEYKAIYGVSGLI